MAQGFRLTVFEPDEIPPLIPGFSVQVTLHKCASYAGSLNALRLGGLWLANGEDNAARTARISMPPDHVAFTMLPGVQQTILAGGIPLQRYQINQHRPGRDFHQTTMGPTLTSLILVAPGYLKHAAEHFGMALPRADLNLMMEPPFQALQRLQRLHIAAMRFVLEEPEMLGRAEAMRSLEWAILEALLVCLTGSALQPPSRARLSRENIMRRFDILLAANPDSNLIMSDVCRELGISTRLLRACCDDQLGMGPKQFLMLRRLHLVRRRLLASGGNRGGVTDIATEYGFWELGRFAVAYRELFGESPSVTLKRPPEIARKAMPAHHTVGDRLHQVKDWLGPQWYAARAMFERHQEAGEIA